MQNKTILRLSLTHVKMAIIKDSKTANAGKDMEEKKNFYFIDKNIKRVLKNLNTEIPFDLQIPDLGISLKN